ncbi:hypothetical protein A462_07974 [Pseudomonas sp. Ag1]|nr:hypothetical protein A462_07974 [Pseudomonas sp. Ag1]
MGIYIPQYVDSAGRAPYGNNDHFIVMTDKCLSISAILFVVEKVQTCWMFLLFTQLGAILLIQLRIEGQNFETQGIRYLFQ